VNVVGVGNADSANILADLLGRHDDACAVNGSTTCGDYEALADAVHFLAQALRDAGLTRRARVGLMTTEMADLVVPLCAAGLLGATVAVLDPGDVPSRTEEKIEVAGLDFVLAHRSTDHVLDELTCVHGVPTVVVDDFSLAEVGPERPELDRGLVFFEITAVRATCGWDELVQRGSDLAARIGLGRRSSITVVDLLVTPESMERLFAAFTAGATVSLGRREVGIFDLHELSMDALWGIEESGRLSSPAPPVRSAGVGA
jgi:AMP-binding enzyme